MLRRTWWLSLAVLVACSSGGGSDEEPSVEPELEGEVLPWVELPDAEDVVGAPESLELEGRTYTAKATIWRDFMPPTPPEGRPMIAVAFMIAQDGLEAADGVTIEELLVLHEDLVWVIEPKAYERSPRQEEEIGASASKGPFWGPDVLVDVVLRITDRDGVEHLLMARDQEIGATM